MKTEEEILSMVKEQEIKMMYYDEKMKTVPYDSEAYRYYETNSHIHRNCYNVLLQVIT